MTATSMNSTVRKTLASQLDRLDGILEALNEGLNAVITEGVKTAVGAAVRQALVEVLTNEELLRHLRGPDPLASPPSTPSTGSGGWVGGLWTWEGNVAERARDTAGPAVRATWSWVGGTARRAGALALAWDPLESTCRHASLSIL